MRRVDLGSVSNFEDISTGLEGFARKRGLVKKGLIRKNENKLETSTDVNER